MYDLPDLPIKDCVFFNIAMLVHCEVDHHHAFTIFPSPDHMIHALIGALQNG